MYYFKGCSTFEKYAVQIAEAVMTSKWECEDLAWHMVIERRWYVLTDTVIWQLK